MTWRGPRTANDPLLTTRQWRTDRKYWQRLGLPCARCGRSIDYLGPRYLMVNGRRKQNPRYLVVGHIVSRRRARILGWTDEQINALSNQQQECQRCSNVSGAREGQRAQRTKQAAMAGRVDTSRRW